MSTIVFNYNGIQTKIQCQLIDKMEDICQKFAIKAGVDINQKYFIYGGQLIDLTLQLNEISHNDKEINILVNNRMTELVNNNTKSKIKFIKSKEIICPECGDICLMKIKDFKITLFQCKNGHKINNILLDEFNNTQKINETKIKCFNCNNNKNISYNNKFFICLTCNKNICPLCISIHSKEHKIIDYDEKNYICHIHNNSYVSYCEKCNINLCSQCEKEHDKTHKKIDFKNIIVNEKEIKEEFKRFRERIENIKNILNEIVLIINEFKIKIEIYYKINNDILNNFKVQNKNYENLMNFQELKKNIKIDELNNIIKGNNIKIQMSNLINIYNKMILRENTLTRNPPKECLIYETMINLNNNFNRIEKEIKDKSKNMRNRIEIMKNNFNKIKNKNMIKLSNCKYLGEEKDNKINGLGIVVFDDGDKYEGEFIDYEKNGIGIDYKSNSYTYMGEFKEGKRIGFGIEENPNIDYIKSRYEGDWLNEINGIGIYSQRFGMLYIGEMNKDMYSGNGKLIWTNGDYFIGEFKEDKKIKGKLFYFEENGVFDSTWEYNKEKEEIIAKGIFYTDDGKKEKRTRIISKNDKIWEYE